MRASEPRVAGVLAMLEREGLAAKWNGRFGVLGARAGFLPAQANTQTCIIILSHA